MPAVPDPRWSAHDLDVLAERLRADGGVWNEFLATPTLRAGLYRLPAGSTDGQKPHDEDELYHVVSGRAVLRVGEGDAAEDLVAEPGAVLFVAAHVPHRFVDIAEDLELLVFFSRADPAQRDGDHDGR